MRNVLRIHGIDPMKRPVPKLDAPLDLGGAFADQALELVVAYGGDRKLNVHTVHIAR